MTMVRDYMTVEVKSLSSSTMIKEALDKFDQVGVRHLPVVNEANRVIGILSDRDKRNIELTLDIFNDASYKKQIENAPVSDVMKREVICAFLDTQLSEAATMMIDLKIGALPVIEDQQLVGIISYTDIIHAYAMEI